MRDAILLAVSLATLLGCAYARPPTHPPVEQAYCPSHTLGGLFVPCRYVRWHGNA